MALNFTTTSKAGESVNILVYGRSGVGKTVLCATTPNPIIISTESGLMSISEFDIPVIEVTTLQDLKDAYDFVTTDPKGKKFDTICLDSISDIAESVLTDLKAQNKDGRAAYGKLADEIAGQIRKFRDIKRNVYFIAKAELYQNASGVECYRPSMPGRKLTGDLPFFFDVVLALRIHGEDEDAYRYLQTSAELTWDAKDRSKSLDPMEKPDLSNIFTKIQDSRVKGKKKKKK